MNNPYLRLIRLDKPIGSLLLLWPTLWALAMAYHGRPPMAVLIAFSLGVFLTRSAGCAINDFADRKFDGQVARTRNRPLATGEISALSAVLLALTLSTTAFVLAWCVLKPYTLIWSLPALLLLLSYPYFKRFCPLPQVYLGIAFSFGILMVYVERYGAPTREAWLLFSANLLWVLAYDTIYALVDLVDDKKIAIKTSALTLGSYVIPAIMLFYVVFLILMLFVVQEAGLGRGVYCACGIVSLLLYIIWGQIRNLEPGLCFKAFLANNRIGWILLLGMLYDYN